MNEWIKISHREKVYYAVLKQERSSVIFNKLDGLEGIMLSEINQTKLNTIGTHLYLELFLKFQFSSV